MEPGHQLQRLARAFEPMCCEPGDNDELRSRKAQFTLAMTIIIPAGLVWGVIYLAAGARLAALWPLLYAVLSGMNLGVLRARRTYRWFQVSELALIVALPFLLQLSLGGFVGGSAVVIWAVLAPLFAVLFASAREAVTWFGIVVALSIVTALVHPGIDVDNSLPTWLITALFVMNFSAVFGISFAMLVSFVGARQRLRELEIAYLDQTVMLRQREKLATLGTLAAGVAHELNNPAAAVRRAADQLDVALADFRTSAVGLTAPEVIDFVDRTRQRGHQPEVSPVERSMREGEIEDWLASQGVGEAAEVAPPLVALGVSCTDLDHLRAVVDEPSLAAMVSLVAQGEVTTELSATIGEGTGRISDIVAALRSYAYLDRGTVQMVDVVEGIESTLVLMRAKLSGMAIERRYTEGLPKVAAHGSELNQVWTNLIDNAIDATDGNGTLVVSTSAAGASVVVELTDDGPGMPPEVAAQVFDPFFTTKPPGSGTGLGLNVSYNIVVSQHQGEMSVCSEPGSTSFRVALPAEDAPVPAEARS